MHGFKATKIGCGDVDILINNAGIITNNKTFASMLIPVESSWRVSLPPTHVTQYFEDCL